MDVHRPSRMKSFSLKPVPMLNATKEQPNPIIFVPVGNRTAVSETLGETAKIMLKMENFRLKTGWKNCVETLIRSRFWQISCFWIFTSWFLFIKIIWSNFYECLRPLVGKYWMWREQAKQKVIDYSQLWRLLLQQSSHIQ